jgi:hypothetical protein
MTDDDDAGQLEGDRRTVAALAAEGDPLTKARQVDHWSFFPTAEARDQFIAEVVPLGFTASDTDAEGEPPNTFCAYVSRVDHVDLESIHGVVMTLFLAAERHGGEHDGWECPVVAPE